MRDNWLSTTLGAIASWGAGGTPKAGDPRFYDGGTIPWAVIADIQDAPISDTEKHLTSTGVDEIGHVAPAESVLVTMYGTVGRVAITTREMATNQAIAWAIPDRSLVSPQFLFHWLRAHRAEIDSLARGATQRNINRAILRELRIELPPLDVQRRIVDVIASLDAGHDAAQREASATEALQTALLASLAEDIAAADTRLLGSLAAPRSGPSWSAVDESQQPSQGSVPVVKITNTKPDGTLDASQLVHVIGVPRSTELLNEESLILIRTNGNRARIGNVYRASPEVYGAAVSAFQFSARFPSVADRDWVYWWLRQPEVQRRMSESASGSTGLGNMSAKWLRSLSIPFPDESVRAAWTDLLESVQATQRALQEALDHQSRLRVALLDRLLAGEIDIPNSYDELLGEVA